jgi:hypothetical protein
MVMEKRIKYIVLTIGTLVGIFYFKDVSLAAFTMSNHVPFWELLWFLTVPVATLPVIILGFFYYRLSGYLLLVFSLLNCLSVIFGNFPPKLGLILHFSLAPMIIGIIIIFNCRKISSKQPLKVDPTV